LEEGRVGWALGQLYSVEADSLKKTKTPFYAFFSIYLFMLAQDNNREYTFLSDSPLFQKNITNKQKQKIKNEPGYFKGSGREKFHKDLVLPVTQ
jgi:hypothetical protein